MENLEQNLEQREVLNNDDNKKMTIKSAAAFASAGLTMFYLFWIMFLGEVIRWNLPDGKLYRPIRDSFLIPFAGSIVVPHHWVGKIITGIILIILLYFLMKKLGRYRNMSEEKMIKNGYALITAFWVYIVGTLLYFIGHLNHFWFF